MKSLKYLNGVLTVIAVCLVLLTMSVLGIIPQANAKESPKAVITRNDDAPMKVDIISVAGQTLPPAGGTVGASYRDGSMPIRQVSKY